MEDCFCWGSQTNGLYSVKTGYHFALKELSQQAADPNSSRTPHDLHWKKLWSIPTQPKFKHFMWRLMSSSLPVRVNLGRRGILVPQLCPWCDTEPETEFHLFRDCSWTKNAWANSPLGALVPTDSELDIAQVGGGIWGVGILIRDHSGTVFAATSQKINCLPDPGLAS
ncbi:Reverse transcriptase zinc-binding domain [Sesbania bispinosa]|nr:Reverse transcriptase zinc-binding domain [Sesbania bispinosa]